jgi:fluoride ion exporter CrcB/FEX
LVREKRLVGLIIAGIVATITAISTMPMASVALSQSIQNDHCVNTLTQNVTCILQQVSVDEKIDVN